MTFLEDDPSGLACPDCPLCGHPPAFVLMGCVQAFCGNDDCEVIIWSPSCTQAENLADQHRTEWP